MGIGQSTQYPFIGATGGERGGIMENVVVDPLLFTAPTVSLTQFNTIASVGLGFIPGAFFKVKFNSVVYRVPIFTNA